MDSVHIDPPTARVHTECPTDGLRALTDDTVPLPDEPPRVDFGHEHQSTNVRL